MAIAAAILWIFGGSLFYYIYFSFTFYHDNQDAILGLLAKLGIHF